MEAQESPKPVRMLTQTIHQKAYPAISPSRPELSQAGRTILVTGGATGIGYAIAQAFSQAAAARVILVGRRDNVLREAVSKLAEYAKQIGSKTEFIGRAADDSDLDSTAPLWTGLEEEGIAVNVLVLNAASISAASPLLERGLDKFWNDYLINVRALVDYTQRFNNQKTAGAIGRKVKPPQPSPDRKSLST